MKETEARKEETKVATVSEPNWECGAAQEGEAETEEAEDQEEEECEIGEKWEKGESKA